MDGELLFSYARPQLNSLTLTVLKANRAKTAKPFTERNSVLPKKIKEKTKPWTQVW